MATFAEIYDNIQSIVERPHLQTFIESRINGAINLISCSGNYKDDLVETTLESIEGISPTAYTQTVPLPDRFRSTLYVDYPDPTGKQVLEPLSVNDIGHRAVRYKSNVYYVSGSLLHIKHDVQTPIFLFGYFNYPAPLSGAQSNWITTRFPWLVEEIVIAAIRVVNGDVEAAAYLDRLNKQEMGIWLQDALRSEQLTVGAGR